MIWYEDLPEPKSPYVKMYCPVCKKDAYLGKREIHQIFTEHCDECRVTYTWQPHEEKPTAQFDNAKKSKACNCGNCAR